MSTVLVYEEVTLRIGASADRSVFGTARRTGARWDVITGTLL
jgi:hypothetical protein